MDNYDSDYVGFSSDTSPFDWSLSLDVSEPLEDWSYHKMVMAQRDSNGKFITTKSKKKSKSILPKSVVGSVFFRSVIYQIDIMIKTAESCLESRHRDLKEFNFYVEDQQVDDDPKYQQELAKEIVFWTKTLDLYKTIKENSHIWFKRGKFPWSGIKVSTPYFSSPSLMTSSNHDDKQVDLEMTPVDAKKIKSVKVKFTPVDSHDKTIKHKAKRSRSRKTKCK